MACYDKRCNFIYKTHTNCSGYIIRKAKWRALEVEHTELYNYIKRQSLFNYLNKVRKPLLESKDQDIEQYDLRADYQQVLCLKNYNANEMKQLQLKECSKGLRDIKLSDEIVAIQKYEERLCSYERYITKIIKNNDNAKRYTIEALAEQKKLYAKNAELRQKAIDAGLDLEQLEKENEDNNKQILLTARRKEKQKQKQQELEDRKPLSRAFKDI